MALVSTPFSVLHTNEAGQLLFYCTFNLLVPADYAGNVYDTTLYSNYSDFVVYKVDPAYYGGTVPSMYDANDSAHYEVLELSLQYNADPLLMELTTHPNYANSTSFHLTLQAKAYLQGTDYETMWELYNVSALDAPLRTLNPTRFSMGDGLEFFSAGTLGSYTPTLTNEWGSFKQEITPTMTADSTPINLIIREQSLLPNPNENQIQLKIDFNVVGLPNNWNTINAVADQYGVELDSLKAYVFSSNGNGSLTTTTVSCNSGTACYFNVFAYELDPQINANGCFTGKLNINTAGSEITFFKFNSIGNWTTVEVNYKNDRYLYCKNGSGSIQEFYGFDANKTPEYFPVYRYYTVTDPEMCFREGTRIAVKKRVKWNSTDTTEAIENLRVGDYVKTHLHGYRKIKRILSGVSVNKNADKTQHAMCVMKKRGDMADDLYMTGGHSLMVDELSVEEAEKQAAIGFSEKVDDKHLLLAMFSPLFEAAPPGSYPHYHLLLDNYGLKNARFGVWANGVLCETPSQNYTENRSQI